MKDDVGELEFLRAEIVRLRNDVCRLQRSLTRHSNLPSPYTLQRSTSLHILAVDAAAKRRKKKGY